MSEDKVKIVYGLPEHLKGKAHEKDKKEGQPHTAGDQRYAAEEWEGGHADERTADTGVPGTSSPRGHSTETVEGREGWRD
ncbi:U5 snRNP spliceosome subunit [Micractinium conductrix]|uniref:U5 snRNP spliceosome subunit n=1 Tax=Micractinium conductrix TaxID=554055 RepID=A0A2P6VHU8_9CHLO|nr:U5 snRNP spliceosome subunit [Micractinium conductrix]|eukprot:PSC73648.1 U5 snRNP spliceosome subunit [Micractinium conductrix]